VGPCSAEGWSLREERSWRRSGSGEVGRCDIEVEAEVSVRIDSDAILLEVDALFSRDSSLGPSSAVFRSEPRRRRVRRCASAADIARLPPVLALLGALSFGGMLDWRSSIGVKKERRARREAERLRLWLDRRLEPAGGRSALLVSIGTGSCRQSTNLGNSSFQGKLILLLQV
jgi:hypothetical protein